MTTNVLNVRQVAQYPRQTAVPSGSVALIQLGELGSPYGSILARDLVATALANGGHLQINAASGAILFSDGDLSAAASLIAAAGGFLFSRPIQAPGVSAASVDAAVITIAGIPVATRVDLDAARAASVTSFNLRTGDIMLMPEDILRAGGAPIRDAHFGGWITAPSVWDTRANDDTVATTNWVHRAIHDFGVSSFNGRTGDVVLTTADISAATAAGPGYPTAPSPPLGDASNRIATTLFVDESLQDLHLMISDEQLALLTSTYAPINSPQLTGIPTAPTANPGTHTGQLATTAFVMNAVTASTSGVSSFNTRTGAVTLLAADISGATGALLNSPAFVGAPTAPTAAPGTNSTVLATTAFVSAAITAAGGVTSFNTRTGAVTLSLADVTGTGVLSNTALSGVPTAPTAAPGTSTTQVATTAFVAASAAAGVTSFMSRTGAITLTGADVSSAGGALNNSPVFVGTPTAPTAAPGTNTTQLATTAFVAAAMGAAGGVTTFNGRAGAVTLISADVTGAGGALLASPTFTGTPAAPTPVSTDNSTALATTAFVQSLLTGWQFSLSAATTWNPSDTTANMTLSNGNLTATSTNFSVGTRAAVGNSSGKFYFEATMANGASTADNIGLATATANLTTTGGAGTTVVINGNIFVNGTSVASFPGIANGSIIGIAVDLTARLIWYRISPSGNWNNSGTANPATGAGGVSISVLGGALYPIYQVGAATGHSATANFGASAFSGVVPSGFISGWGTAVSIAAGTGAAGDRITSQGSIQLVPGGSGTVQAPTMTAGDNSTAIATTAFVAAVATGGIKSIHIQKFTAAGAFTYTPTTGMVNCIVEAVGGGGGGGGSGGGTTQITAGGGGGGGAYARKLLTAAQVGASLAGSVGAGGGGVSSGTAGNGGDTSLAALAVARGGSGGVTGLTSAIGTGSSGGLGSASTGDVVIDGMSGGDGDFASGSLSKSGVGGTGGGSQLGSPAPGHSAGGGSTSAGTAGKNYGGGGSGAVSDQSATAMTGGNGASGIVIITEFCSQ